MENRLSGRKIAVIVVSVIAIFAAGVFVGRAIQKGSTGKQDGDPEVVTVPERFTDKIFVTINGEKIETNLADSTAAAFLAEKLKSGPIEVKADDYGNHQKAGSLGFTLPAEHQEMPVMPGDIVLAEDKILVLLYGPDNGPFTKLASLVYDENKLYELVGHESITITLSLD